MKITKLVVLFNYQKIVLGIVVSLLSFYVATQVSNPIITSVLFVFGVVVILNIILSLIAAYITYDTSDLYKLNKLPDYISLDKTKEAIFIHASFDPISNSLEVSKFIR